MLKPMQYVYLTSGSFCLLYYLALGLGTRFGLSLSWVWIAAGVALLGACALAALPIPGPVRIAFRSALIAGVALIAALVVLVASDMRARPDGDVDALIVLGARVNPDGTISLALRHRIDAAIDYLNAHPDCIAIASGGQGADEPEAEAEAIARELKRAGIAEARIRIENRSLNTNQNLRFSRELIEDPDARVAVVTNNYHVFRARLLARRAGFRNPQGLAATYGRISLPHYIVREAICLIAEKLRGTL